MFFLLLILLLNTSCVSTHALKSSRYSSKESIPEIISTKKDANYYTVKKGDTLWSIARRFNTTIDRLTIENNIKKDRTLIIGDKLLIPLLRRYKENKLLFLWPTKGKIVTYFGEKINNKLIKGIQIQTKENTVVKSSAKGKVTFNNYLKGYGNTIIVKHPSNLFTIYANLSESFVKENDYVKKGEVIGKTGKDLRKGVYLLHFELRKNHKAENPLAYLSAN